MKWFVDGNFNPTLYRETLRYKICLYLTQNKVRLHYKEETVNFFTGKLIVARNQNIHLLSVHKMQGA